MSSPRKRRYASRSVETAPMIHEGGDDREQSKQANNATEEKADGADEPQTQSIQVNTFSFIYIIIIIIIIIIGQIFQ